MGSLTRGNGTRSTTSSVAEGTANFLIAYCQEWALLRWLDSRWSQGSNLDKKIRGHFLLLGQKQDLWNERADDKMKVMKGFLATLEKDHPDIYKRLAIKALPSNISNVEEHFLSSLDTAAKASKTLFR